MRLGEVIRQCRDVPPRVPDGGLSGIERRQDFGDRRQEFGLVPQLPKRFPKGVAAGLALDHVLDELRAVAGDDRHPRRWAMPPRSP